jgi:hypothetical protein
MGNLFCIGLILKFRSIPPEFIAYAKSNPGKVNYASSCFRRVVQDYGRYRYDPRSLSRHGRRANRPARRTSADGVRQHFDVNRAHQSRQTPPTSGDYSKALGNASGPPHRGGFSAGLRAERVLRHRRTRATPPEIIDRLNKEINSGLAGPKIRVRLAEIAGTPLPGSSTLASLLPRRPTNGAR